MLPNGASSNDCEILKLGSQKLGKSCWLATSGWCIHWFWRRWTGRNTIGMNTFNGDTYVSSSRLGRVGWSERTSSSGGSINIACDIDCCTEIAEEFGAIVC